MGLHQPHCRLVANVKFMTLTHITEMNDIQKPAEQFQQEWVPIVFANGGRDFVSRAAYTACLE